ncbi:Glycoside hydrolase [Trema orientale]|uniref:glucan endo-1,3-beta-D-glucosidase n=1 Tax=Trema orientale TaxID=63057 RepID=A0A2P5EUD2_TREOI|nr:Glycoside hydrolase [Trema orientale]
MRIYDPNPETLKALRGSNIELIVDIFKANLQGLTNDAAAANWVQTNIRAYSPDVKFRYIAVGNEVRPGDPEAKFVLPAMKSIQNAISSANLGDQIKVSTAIDTTLLGDSSPPSDGVFSAAASPYITPIVKFLAEKGAPLLANVYPYFSYTENRGVIDLGYALFTSPKVVVIDKNGKGYKNLFDAQVDSLYSALEKAGAPGLKVVVSESGWPSQGDQAATTDNARTYYRNLIGHVKDGTPKRPQGPIETFLFAMFDEDKKDGAAVEKHFGLFFPNKQPKYQLSFS